MRTPSRFFSTVGILLALYAAGCVHGKGVRMNPALPIETTDGYRQNGEVLDPKDMLERLGRAPASKGRIRLARTLSTIANLCAAVGGGLAGWQAGKLAAGGEADSNVLYGALGTVGAGLTLAIGGVLSVKGAVRAHNRSLGVKEILDSMPPTTQRTTPSTTDHARPGIIEQGSLLVAEADLGGVTLRWLGDVDATHPRVGFRLQHSTMRPAFDGCEFVDVRADERTLRLPISYKSDPDHGRMIERVQAELDSDTLRTIVEAKNAQFKICDVIRSVTVEASMEGRLLLNTYEARLAQQQRTLPPAAEPLVPSAPLEAAAPQATAQEPGRDTAAPVTP